jgi:hypothetical protein
MDNRSFLARDSQLSPPFCLLGSYFHFHGTNRNEFPANFGNLERLCMLYSFILEIKF